MSKKTLIGAIATAAAISFVIAPVTSSVASAAHSTKAPCYGVNSCKGTSACKTATNACKGKNSCKGKGMSMKSAKKCTKLKGTTEAPKS